MNALVQELTQRYWVGHLQTRLPYYAAVLAIVLLTHSLARMTWALVPQPNNERQSELTQSSTPRMVPSVVNEQPVALKIANLNLFGKYEPAKTVEEPRPVVVPETKLNLKLRGVFASKDTNAARAIIADARGDEDSYRIGSEVPGGAVLTEIHPDHVIIKHNGRYETLKLPVEEGQEGGAGSRSSMTGSSYSPAGASPMSRTSAMRSSSSGSHTDSASNAGSPGGGGGGNVDIEQLSSSVADNAELLGQYRTALLNNPNSVMGLINVGPYEKDGQLVGYRIRPGKDRALLQRFGLRSGDVVTSVNGVPMNNPVKALEVLRDLSSASQITVDIDRNGTPQTFTFQIQ